MRELHKSIRGQIRAFFAGFGFLAKCLCPCGICHFARNRTSKKIIEFGPRSDLCNSLLWLIVFCCATVGAEEQKRAQLMALQNAIEKVIAENTWDVNVGIEVVSMDTGDILYQKNPHHRFVPASCLKMCTGAAALHYLGPDFHFETQMFTDGCIEQHILKGNLYLKGSGDPELATRDLEELAFHLKSQGVQHIEGNLCADNSLFDGISQGPGWMWDEGAYQWNSPMDALMVNHSCIDVVVSPSEKKGQNALVEVSPKTEYILLHNSAETTDKEGAIRVDRRWMQKENVVEVTGQIPLSSPPVHMMIPIEHPHLYAAQVFRDLLVKAGIAFKGKIETRMTPQNALLLGTHTSRPLSLIMEEMMKPSDNLYADSLFKRIGEVRFGPPGTWKKGAMAVREFLGEVVHLDVEKLVIVDGSGLSRYNLISAHHFVTFLAWIHTHFRCYPEFVAALPVSGTDGTLLKRMEAAELKGKVCAKTGCMTGISSLSGYLMTKMGETLAFTILQNGFTGKAEDCRTRIEDGICRLLIKGLD